MKTTYGQTKLAVIPLRAEARHSSEMVSQLLYNETYTILEEQKDWLWVACFHDAYEGWLPRNQVYYISQEEFDRPFLSFSSNLLTWDKELKQYIFMASPSYQAAFSSPLTLCEQIYQAAEQFLNTAYLWGGRSALGIDCSGLMQVIFRIGKIVLPRDSSQQVLLGKTVVWAAHQLGDLAFFENKQNKITHVGLVWNNNQILHASGWVRIDKLTKQGIFHQGQQTHHLSIIKRISS